MKKILSCLIAAMLIMSCFISASAEDELVLFVDGKATENGDGSMEAPFASFEAAQSKIRELKKNGEYPSGGITVYVREGNYSFKDGLTFTAEDSGEENAPVTWRPYINESVKLLGGSEIKLSDCTVVTDSSILSKMPSGMSGKVYQINLREKGLDMYGDLNVTGHASYYTRLYGVTQGNLPVPEIFYNGEAMPLAQYPNKGSYMTIDKVVDPGENMWGWSSETPPRPGTFGISDTRAKRWSTATDAWVWGNWQYDWSDQTCPVKYVDGTAQTIELGIQSCYELTVGQKFYIYNLIEELDVPGEWFLDKTTGILYLYPLDTNPNSSMILSFSSSTVVTMEKVSNFNFREFEILGTRANGITATNLNNVKLSYLSIGNLSGVGISALACYNTTIEGCNIYNTGMKSIDVSGGDGYTLTPSNNLVFNNHLHDFGRLVTTYEGGIRATGVGNHIKNNLIYNGSHLGVNPGGNDNIFEYNEIRDVMKTSADMGAVYCDFGMTSRGNVFRYNKIHSLKSDSAHAGKYAIYLDNCSSGMDVYGNFIYDIDGTGVFINGGRNNSVYHNVFANLTNYSVYHNASGMAAGWGWYQGWLNGSRNYGLLGESTAPYNSETYSKYPNMNGILDDNPPMTKYNRLEKNVTYNAISEYKISPEDGGTGLTMEDMYDNNTIIPGLDTKNDVGFTDIQKSNFSLKDDSVVYEKIEDFPKLEYDRMGLVTSQLKSLLYKNSVALAIGKSCSYVNFERTLVDSNDYEITPFIENDRTYVPVRFLFESFGATVEYNNGEITADYNGNVIKLNQNSNIAYLNGAEIEMENAVITKNGRTFVPLRAISELLEKKVFWDDCGLIVVTEKDISEKMNEDRVYDLYNRM